MPPAPNYELSLRHLPDMSDSSFSFQIPGNCQDTYILADDGLDFLKGADLSRGTPQISPVRATKRPLSINNLTPGPMSDIGNINNTERRFFSMNQRSPDTIPKQGKAATRLYRPEPTKLPSKVLSNPRPDLPSSTYLSPTKDIQSIMTRLRARRDPPINVLVSPSVTAQEPTGTQSDRAKGDRRTILEKKLPSTAAPSKYNELATDYVQFAQGDRTTLSGPSHLTEILHSGFTSRPLEQESTIFPSLEKPSLSEDLNGDESTTNMGLGSGVAERLVQYSQTLMNSFETYKNREPSMEPSASRTDSHVQFDAVNGELAVPSSNRDDGDGRLTLSQFSPRKRPSRVEATPTPPASTSVSSMTSTGKRPASVATENACRKKSRTQAPTTASTSSSSSTSLSIRDGRHLVGSTQDASKPSSSRQPVIDTEALRKKTSVSSRKASTIRAKRVSGNSGVTMTRLASASGSLTSKGSTRVLRESRSQGGVVKQSGHTSSLTRRSKVASAGKLLERPVFQIPPLRDANPTPFTEPQHLTSKDKPRREEVEPPSLSQSKSQSQSEKKYRLPIPDFKAMHAAQEAKLALLKENTHPTLPQSIRLETDRRVIERQKFDEMVKEKQRDHERLMERKRREREEQEERELRELRKKSIPKAHTVPEWYKEAPKKKDKHAGSLGR